MSAVLISMNEEQARGEKIWKDLFCQLDNSYTVFHNYPLRSLPSSQINTEYSRFDRIPWIVFHNNDFRIVIPSEEVQENNIDSLVKKTKALDSFIGLRIPEYRKYKNRNRNKAYFTKPVVVFCRTEYEYDERIKPIWESRKSSFIRCKRWYFFNCNLFEDNEKLRGFVNLFRMHLEEIFTKAKQSLENEAIISKRQKEVLSGQQNKYKIMGVAGSGKTITLIQKALKSVAEGKRVLIVVKNNALETSLADRIDPIIDDQHIDPTILTIDRLLYWTDPDCRVHDGKTLDLETKKRLYDAAAEHIIDHPELVGLKYDVILVDEAQDFSSNRFRALSKFWVNDKDSELLVFGDVMQDISGCSMRDPDEKNPAIRRPSLTGFDFPGRWTIWKECYRAKNNVSKIYREFAEKYHLTKVFGGEDKDVQQEQPSLFNSEDYQSLPVGDFYCFYSGNRETIISKAVSLLGKLSGENGLYNNNLGTIAILSTKHDDLDEVRKQIKEKYGALRMLTTEDRDAKRDMGLNVYSDEDLVVSTIHSFKGFEKDTVLLIISGNPPVYRNNVIFSGLSRAKERLVVLLSEELGEYKSFFDDYQKELLNNCKMFESFFSSIVELIEVNSAKWDDYTLLVGGKNANNDYTSLINRIGYVYIYFSRYVYEYYVSFRSLFEKMNLGTSSKETISVLSVGCGPAPDLFAIQALLAPDGGLEKKIKYVGIDIATWNGWEDDYKVGRMGSKRIVYDSLSLDSSFHFGPENGDVIKFLEHEEMFDFDIIHFPCSFIEIKQSENGTIVIDKMLQMLQKRLKK